jgi:hypothetical protein
MPGIDPSFRSDLLKLGIISYREQETLWQIALRCAKTAGVPAAGAGMLLMAEVTTVAIPGVGAVPGAVAGLLAGLVSGTVTCTMANASMRQQLRTFAADQTR